LKSGIKIALWTLAVVMIASAIAAPKVLPLLHPTEGKQDARVGAAADRGGGGKSGEKSVLRVSAVTLQPSSFAEVVTATGTLLAEEGIELQPETNGKIAAIHFREGSPVRKGDLLVKLNDADLRATLSRAKFRKELAMLREKRISQLLKQGVARQEEYDTALNELNVQDAEIELSQAQLAKTEIRAPFDGVIGLRFVSEGAFVNATTRIATLQRIDRLKVDFSVAEKYAARVRLGSPIRFTIAGGDREFGGEIYAFDPRIEAGTRTVLIRALCPNPHGRLLPGAFANVAVTLAQLNDALMVPAVAVIPGLNEKNVFVIKDGKAERRAVETGTRLESTVHVLSGLTAGDTVITSGLQQMRPGQAVSVITESST
jgi:membrane fusion protein (multidrug efflux system)